MSIAPALCALAWLTCGLTAGEPASTYRLRISSTVPLEVSVRATLPASKGLSMSDYGAWSQPRGWATFVRELEVGAEDGAALQPIVDGSGWQLPAGNANGTALSYTVDLSHLSWPTWPDGPRTTSGLRTPDGTFVLLGALLIQVDRDGPCELVFEGEEWGRVAAPFERTGARTFRMDSLRLGAENAIAFQLDELTETFVGDLRVQVAALGRVSETTQLSALVNDALEEFARTFRAPQRGQLLALVYPDAWDTGEAYTDSFVLATTSPLTEDRVAVWGQSVAHELFHRWLGATCAGRVGPTRAGSRRA